MSTYKVKFKMYQLDRKPSYTWYKEGETAKAVMDELLTDIQKFYDFFGVGTILKSLSVANIDGLRRDRKNKPLNLGVEPADVSITPDVATTSVNLNMSGAAGDSLVRQFTGLNDEDVLRIVNGADQPSPSMNAAIARLADYIIDHQLQIQVSQRAVPGTEWAWKQVGFLAPEANTGNRNTVVNLLEPHGWDKGQKVTFQLPPDDVVVLGFANDHKILNDAPAEDDEAFTVNVRYRGSDPTYTPDGMNVRKVGFTYTNIAEVEFHSFSSRQRGSSGGPRGRASGRSFRH